MTYDPNAYDYTTITKEEITKALDVMVPTNILMANLMAAMLKNIAEITDCNERVKVQQFIYESLPDSVRPIVEKAFLNGKTIEEVDAEETQMDVPELAKKMVQVGQELREQGIVDALYQAFQNDVATPGQKMAAALAFLKLPEEALAKKSSTPNQKKPGGSGPKL